jgi:hypothetical protein
VEAGGDGLFVEQVLDEGREGAGGGATGDALGAVADDEGDAAFAFTLGAQDAGGEEQDE